MKLRSRIAVTEEEAEKALKPLGIRFEVKRGVAIAYLFLDDARYPTVIDKMKSMGIHFNEEKRRLFGKEEMEVADFFHMVSRAQWGYPEPQEDYGRKSFDKSTACRMCGTGAKQVRPFSLRGTPRFGRGDIVSLFWVYEYIVTEHLKKIVEGAGLTGAEFWPVMAFSERGKEQPLKGTYQLYITSVLRPMSPEMRYPAVRLPRGIQPCECERIGRNLPIEPLRYRRSDLANAKDFNKSSEWLGGGLDTAQMKIVSRRVYDLFIKNKFRGVDFEPIVLES